MSPSASSESSAGTRREAMNFNVKLTLIQVAMVGVADSVWTGTVLAAFIYVMERDAQTKNTSVGAIEAAQGMATLISAVPVGYLADKHGRSPLIAAGGALSVVAAVVTAYVVWVAAEEDAAGKGPPKWAMITLAGCMVAWGISGGIVSGPAQALYADSIPHGERSKWYTYLFGSYLVASAVGPALAVVLFHVYGNGWSLVELRNVMLVGLGLEVVASIPSFFLRDRYALGSENDVNLDDDHDQDGAPQSAKQGSGVVTDGDASHRNGGTTQTLSTDEHVSDETTSLLPTRPQSKAGARASRGCIRKKHIPYVMFISGLFVALGSGMTVKFFPLFFKNTLELSPASTSLIYVITPLGIAGLSPLGTWLAKYIGRIETILLLSAFGISCLVALSMTYHIIPPVGVIAIYIVRTGLMNCTYPLSESIVMDSVPKNQRARWKSLESILQFGWCGSAVLGGVLADRFDYAFTFLITAAMQGFGLSLLLLIRHVVPAESKLEKKVDESNKGSSGATAATPPPVHTHPLVDPYSHSEREDVHSLVINQ